MGRLPETDSPRQFVVQGNDVATGLLSAHVAKDPSVQMVERISPDTVILMMPQETSARLRARFTTLRIEPNVDLAHD